MQSKEKLEAVVSKLTRLIDDCFLTSGIEDDGDKVKIAVGMFCTSLSVYAVNTGMTEEELIDFIVPYLKTVYKGAQELSEKEQMERTRRNN